MLVFQLGLFTVESLKLFVRALLHFSNNYQTPPWLLQMLQQEVFTLTDSHLLYTSMHLLTIRTIYTVLDVPHVLEKPVPS
jgi:hypothetical protein